MMSKNEPFDLTRVEGYMKALDDQTKLHDAHDFDGVVDMTRPAKEPSAG